MLHMYFLNDFEIAPVAPIITGITFVFTFHCIIIIIKISYKLFKNEDVRIITDSHLCSYMYVLCGPVAQTV